MRFINRRAELARLDAVTGGGLAILYGRRRIGKSRLLVEWAKKRKGVYYVADQSAPDVQRRYLATAVASMLPGFADVEYPDWRSLFARLATDSERAEYRGPVIIDELPYLVVTSPELPSVLQQWLDHGAKEAKLAVALAGSSQRMMQGLVLDHSAPLFGRADELFELLPLEPAHIREVFRTRAPRDAIEVFAAWGGVPRYWELAERVSADVCRQVSHLVLDPAGPLHQEPDRLLIEEIPSAVEVRPVLDAIGGGAHRVSEIAGRLGTPATSLSRPLARLVAMGIVRREVPFGEPPRKSRRSLYKISDPFFRLWFCVVAPHRSQLAAGSEASRHKIMSRYWQGLKAATWEDLCRAGLPNIRATSRLGKIGPWEPGSRWWHANAPEWDIVAMAMEGKTLLLGEAKLTDRPLSKRMAQQMTQALSARPQPALPTHLSGHGAVKALFVPALAHGVPTRMGDVVIVTAADFGIFKAR
ncbi:ATP-binding protein [Myxococcota bacterium]